MLDGGQRHWASEAMAPQDFDARAAVAARLAAEPAMLDLRVREPSPAAWPTSPMPSDVSMRDLLGASLITYDHHLGQLSDVTTAVSSPDQAATQLLAPKAVYMQYHSQDPVTGEFSPVVVPASLSLDVFADSMWLCAPPEEEILEEEEKEDNEEEDKTKMTASIKGDPILMRAKPAPAPEAYFAPTRRECLPKLCDWTTSGASGASGAKVSAESSHFFTRQVEASGAMNPFSMPQSPQRSGAMNSFSIPQSPQSLQSPQSPQSPQSSHVAPRNAEASGTMSSFLKANGKDKYSRSRIGEIDQILKAALNRDQNPGQSEVSSPRRPASQQQRSSTAEGLGSPRSRPATRGGTPRSPRGGAGAGTFFREGDDGAALASQMAMYIRRMPQFHKCGKSAKAVDRDPNNADLTAPVVPGAEGTEGTEEGEGTEGGRRSPGSQSVNPESGLPSPPSTAPVSPRRRANTEDLEAEASSRHSSKKTCNGAHGLYGLNGKNGTNGKNKKLRDLDPHIDISDSVPTQRLHSNWPDGQRRMLARHFYGLTAAQILEEEEKERIRARRAVQRKDTKDEEAGGDEDTAADADASAKEAAVDEEARAKANARREKERRSLERTFARGKESGTNFHRLEIRIRNVSRPERVVVGRPTNQGESQSRSCVLMGSLGVERKGLSTKF